MRELTDLMPFGTLKIGKNGYWIVKMQPDSPLIRCCGVVSVPGKEWAWCRLHRVLACVQLKRLLTDEEKVTFHDGNKLNCSVSNLRIWTKVKFDFCDKGNTEFDITELLKLPQVRKAMMISESTAKCDV